MFLLRHCAVTTDNELVHFMYSVTPGLSGSLGSKKEWRVDRVFNEGNTGQRGQWTLSSDSKAQKKRLTGFSIEVNTGTMTPRSRWFTTTGGNGIWKWPLLQVGQCPIVGHGCKIALFHPFFRSWNFHEKSRKQNVKIYNPLFVCNDI